MLLKDLREGEDIVLEIVWGDNHYRIANNVIAQKDEGIVIHAVLCKGEVLDLGSKRLSDMVYQISTQDRTDGHLIVWKSVQMEKMVYNGQQAYYVKAPAFAQLAVHNERRRQKRTIIDVQCRVEYGNDIPVTVKGIVHDISDSGIAFYIAGSVDQEKRAYAIEWKDTAREQQFHLRLHCTSVRTVQQTGHTLVGCIITKSDPNLLEYILYKRTERPEEPDE
jgi:hypothetical protein